MAVRPILRLGHPMLREVAKPVEAFDTPELHALIEDMLDTMRAADGAGLAAIQIGVLLRVVIFGIDYNPRYAKIRYRGADAYGRPIDRTVTDFHARVVQHECDHLDGILYPQRIEDMRQFGFQDELLASGVLPSATPAD
jgi:peptide deformylase